MDTDGTENQKDPSAEAAAKDAANQQDASKGKQETSDAPKTYTESDVQKIRSDALAKAGRDVKSIEARETVLKQREEAQAHKDREQEEREYESLRGKPDELKKWQDAKTIEKDRKAVQADRALAGIALVAPLRFDSVHRATRRAHGTAIAFVAYHPAKERNLGQERQQSPQRA